MRRSLHEAGHEDFRETVRARAEKDVVPFHDQWELMRIGATGVGLSLHNDVAGPYLRDLGRGAGATLVARLLPR